MKTNMRTALVLVGCCGLVFWAARVVWETQNPAVRAVKALNAADASERLDAVFLLQRADPTTTTGAIVPLIARLGDADAHVRAAAAETLGTMLAQSATPNDPDFNERRAVTAGLLTALTDEAPSVRLAAAMALWSIGNSGRNGIDFPLAAARLAERLDDPDTVVRREVMRALGKIGPWASDEPPAALVAALKDPDTSVRDQVVNALDGHIRGLHRLVPHLVRCAEQDNPGDRAIALELLARLRPREWIGTGTIHPKPKPGSFAPEDVPTLIAALSSRDPGVRCVVAANLAAFEGDALTAVPALVASLRSSKASPLDASRSSSSRFDDLDPAAAAAVALGRIAPIAPSIDAISALMEALRSPRAAVRVTAAVALGQFGAAGAVALPDLIEALRATMVTNPPDLNLAGFRGWPDQSIAQVIARLAAIAESSAAADVLVEALGATSWRERMGAADGLSELARTSASARARLIAALGDPDPVIRAAAARILARLTTAKP